MTARNLVLVVDLVDNISAGGITIGVVDGVVVDVTDRSLDGLASLGVRRDFRAQPPLGPIFCPPLIMRW